jgi:hypothetical protein
MRITFPGRIGSTRAAGSLSMSEPAAGRLSVRDSVTAGDFGHAAWWQDATAGCEFVDDRIRVGEPGERDWRNDR